MPRFEELMVYTDGGARGNPGPAAIGVVMKTPVGRVVRSFGRYIGEATNNQAEYRALLAALEEARALGARSLRCYLDSELLVKQLNREYRVKDRDLQSLFVKVWNLIVGFSKISFTHISREQNREADREVNRAMDARR